MKNLLLFAASMLLFTASAADSFFTVQIHGFDKKWKPGSVQIESGENSSVEMERCHWIKGERKLCSIVTKYAKAKKLSDQWENVKVEINTSGTGWLKVQVSGRWTKDPKTSGWLAVSDFRLNGKPLPNGGLSKAVKDKEGKLIPARFALRGDCEYLPKQGPSEDSGAVILNSAGTISFNVPVEKDGETFLFEFKVKAVPAPEK